MALREIGDYKWQNKPLFEGILFKMCHKILCPFYNGILYSKGLSVHFDGKMASCLCSASAIYLLPCTVNEVLSLPIKEYLC